MPHARRVAARALLIAIALAAHAAAPPHVRADAASEAEALYQRALAYQQKGTIEARRQAMVALERATQLAPKRADYQLELGRVYQRMGYYKQARSRYMAVERMDSQNADAWFGIGQVWRHDWLKYLEYATGERAIAAFRRAAELRPSESEFWLQLVPLLVEKKEWDAAGAAAERARAAAPDRAEALLAVAYTSYRLGGVGRADSLFRRTIPKLPRLARERFDDIAPVASAQDTAILHRLSDEDQVTFIQRFWREHDPDLVSPENEAQLEYWSRVAQAYFLYFDQKRREWDMRGEVYVRYGPPDQSAYNPMTSALVHLYSTGPAYPMNLLVWNYPSLGMQVQLEDRLLSEYYLLPRSMVYDMDPHPAPGALDIRDDVLGSRGGRGVFPVLPPGAKPRPANGMIARFSGEKGPVIFGEVETPGAPGDSLWAEWVVLDSSMTEVVRAGREAGVSVCDPAQLRAADFTAQLKPGHYVVGMSVRDNRGGRGVVRTSLYLGTPPATLSLSDAVVTCGRPDVTTLGADGASAIRLEASPSAEVYGSGPLRVYFEMYDLRPDENGTSRFEYEATVRSADKDPRIWIQRLLQPRAKIPEISASRREEQPGSLRRQFVSVPVGELNEGRYVLDIKVRDLNAGEEAVTHVPFVKRAGSGTGAGADGS